MEIKDLPELNIGIVGHIDHGKTTLVSKLTGKFTDTHSEELKRGITIKLGYAEVILYKCEKCKEYSSKEKCECGGKGIPVRYVSVVDAPGHEMLMATMLSGAAIIDVAILVIAANEGIKPQTREHLVALEAKKVNKILIVQNKIDLVTKEQAKKNYEDIKNFVKGTIAENSSIIPISAQQEINISEIFKFLAEIDIPERDVNSDPIFLVARSFDINRPGTKVKDLHGGVLGGILKRGTLKVGDEIKIQPGIIVEKSHKKVYQPLTTNIISLRKGNLTVDKILPGGSVAIETDIDPTYTKADTLSGCVVGKTNSLPQTTEFIKIKFKLFDQVFGSEENEKPEPVKTSEMLLLSVDTTITVGIVTRIKNNEAELSLRIPITPIKGNNLGIARNIKTHWRLIGFGEIL